MTLFLFGKLFEKAYARIIGEILVGLILGTIIIYYKIQNNFKNQFNIGPQVLDFIPHHEAFSMLGEIGLLLIIL